MSSPDLLNTTLNFVIADVSTAGQVYVPIPTGFDGTIIEVQTALATAITGADAGLTLKIGGTAVTNGTITITQSGSAAGDVDSCSPTGANAVRVGEAIEIETDGASSTASVITGTIVIRR